MEERSRPIGVTVLAILAGILAILAAIAALQWLGFFPFLGPGPAIRTFNLWYALMYGLLAWIYIWLAQMLWSVDESAWIFLAVITVFNLILGFVSIVSSEWQGAEVTTAIILNTLILIYIMLPGTRRAFGRA